MSENVPDNNPVAVRCPHCQTVIPSDWVLNVCAACGRSVPLEELRKTAAPTESVAEIAPTEETPSSATSAAPPISKPAAELSEPAPELPQDDVSLETAAHSGESVPSIPLRPCATHPTVEAAQFCPACGKPYCNDCLVEFHGRKICGVCKDMEVAAIQRQQNQTPPVWGWYVAYCIVMALLYLFCLIFGIVILALGGNIPDVDKTETMIQGVVMVVMGSVFTVPFAIAPFLPKKPRAWIYHFVMICVGMTSICCLPASIPLLIFWIKPETQQFFGRQ